MFGVNSTRHHSPSVSFKGVDSLHLQFVSPVEVTTYTILLEEKQNRKASVRATKCVEQNSIFSSALRINYGAGGCTAPGEGECQP